MNAPAISVITPVWNGLPFIQECVESVLAQSFSNWELRIGDNGSTDGTRDYLRSISDPRVHVTFHETNRGIFGNLNYLFEQAAAPVSHILCADDYLLPGGLQTIVDAWSVQPESVGAIRFNLADMRQSSCELVRYSMQVIPSRITPDEADLLFFVFGNMPGNLSNMSVRTSMVRQAGFFDPSFPYAGDFEFWLRLARIAEIAWDGRDVIYVRRHPGVASNYLNTKGELVGQLRRIVDNLYQRLKCEYPSWLLRLHATINYDTLNRHVGFKRWLQNRRDPFLQTLNASSDQSEAFYGRFLRWMLYFGSGAGHWGRKWVAMRLLNNHRERAK